MLYLFCRSRQDRMVIKTTARRRRRRWPAIVPTSDWCWERAGIRACLATLVSWTCLWTAVWPPPPPIPAVTRQPVSLLFRSRSQLSAGHLVTGTVDLTDQNLPVPRVDPADTNWWKALPPWPCTVCGYKIPPFPPRAPSPPASKIRIPCRDSRRYAPELYVSCCKRQILKFNLLRIGIP